MSGLGSFLAAREIWQTPLVASVMAGALLGFLGVYVVLRRTVFVSAALTQLLAAAEEAGVRPTAAKAVVRGVLATFADRLPPGERHHIGDHLPADVRPLFVPPRRIAGTRPPRSVHDLVGRIAGTTPELPLERSEPVTAAVIRTLRTLVPDEAADVAAVLPVELRDLWQGAGAA